jgi:hypothetical protein
LKLRDRLAAARKVGLIGLGEAHGTFHSAADGADAALAAAGGTPIGAAWIEVGQGEVPSLIRALLAFDLAYGGRCMPNDKATAFASEVLALVPHAAHFLTNIDKPDWLGLGGGFAVKTHTFTPVTPATFSGAVAVVGPERSVALTVSDED